jgi:hypothetical protein
MAETIPKFVYNSITITLDYPLVTNDPYQINAKRTDTYSISGIKQTSFDYNEVVKAIDAQFVSSSLKDSLYNMYYDWASEGKTIDYYPDATSGSFDTVTIVENSFKIQRQALGTNVFKVHFSIRKEIT